MATPRESRCTAASPPEAGATAVEFSLIALLLFTLVFGIIGYGIAYNRQQGVHAAVREAARLASLGSTVTYAQVQARWVAAAPPTVRPSDFVFKIHEGVPSDPHDDLVPGIGQTETWCDVAGAEVTVSVTLKDEESVRSRYYVTIPAFNAVLPGLDASATFMCEAPQP